MNRKTILWITIFFLLSSLANATLFFNDTWDRATCTGDCWTTPTSNGFSYTYTNPGSGDFAIVNGVGFINDTTAAGDPVAQSIFNGGNAIGNFTWSFQWKYTANTNCRAKLSNLSQGKFLRLSTSTGNITFFNGTIDVEMKATINNTWGNYSIYVDTKNNESLIFLNSIEILNTSILQNLNIFNAVSLDANGAGTECDSYYDNMTIVSGFQVPPFFNSTNFSIAAIDDFTGTSILNFSALINGTVYNSNVTTGILTTGINRSKGFIFNIVISAENYINNTFTNYNTSQHLIAQMELGGTLTINVFDADTLLPIVQTIDVSIINSTSQRDETITTGSKRFIGFEDGQVYTILFTTSLYNDTTATFTFGENVSPLNIYMIRNGSKVTFIIQDTLLNLLQDATVKVEKFVGGVYQEVGSRPTDGVGRASFNLLVDTLHRVTVSKATYVTQQFIITTDLNEYIISLELLRQFSFDTPQTTVSYTYNPKNDTLNLQLVNFSIDVNDTGISLATYGIRIYNGSTLVASVTNTSNAAGGIQLLEFNTTPYNGSILLVEYFFKKTGFIESTKQVFYIISDERKAFTGNILQIRDFSEANISLRDRLILWTVVLIIFSISLVAFGITGSKNILATAVFSWIIAWAFAFSTIWIVFISILNIVFILAGLKLASIEGI